jgi:hypothetical protein
VPAAADCSAAVPGVAAGPSARSPAVPAGTGAAGAGFRRSPSSGTGAPYAGAVSPRWTASRLPTRVGSPAGPASSAPGRSSRNPASCLLISLNVHSGAPRVGIGCRPACSSPTSSSADSVDCWSKNS